MIVVTFVKVGLSFTKSHEFATKSEFAGAFADSFGVIYLPKVLLYVIVLHEYAPIKPVAFVMVRFILLTIVDWGNIIFHTLAFEI